MVIKQRFASNPTAVASYDYQDIADGTGIITFYAFIADSTPTYHLGTKSDVYSGNIEITVPDADETYTFNSSSFNTPRTCKGTAIINLSRYSDGTDAITYALTLQKVSGGTATNLATTSSQVVGTSGTSVITFSLSLTETSFGVGDNLRLVIQVTGKAANTIKFGIDPANRTAAAPSTNTITKLPIYMPFKIQE